MQIQIYSKNVVITDPLKVYLEERLAKIDHPGLEVISCRADISRDQHHHKGDIFRVEINLNIPKKNFRVVEFKPDAREAIDLVVDKLTRQLRDFKDKKISSRRGVDKLSRLMKLWRK